MYKVEIADGFLTVYVFGKLPIIWIPLGKVTSVEVISCGQAWKKMLNVFVLFLFDSPFERKYLYIRSRRILFPFLIIQVRDPESVVKLWIVSMPRS